MTPAVVVTGLGVISALGVGLDAFFAGLSRPAPLRPLALADDRFPPLPPLAAATVDGYDPAALLGRKGLRTLSRESLLFLGAAALACRGAGLDPAGWERSRVGVFAGTVHAGLGDYMEFLTDGFLHGPGRVDPAQGPQTGFNAPASQLAIRFGTEAANVTLSSGRASGIDALAYAADFVRAGRASVILAGGVDALSYFAALGLAAGAMPAGPARPFDAGRDGAVAGEAAAVLVLEDAEHARRRGAAALATVGAAGSAFAPQADAAGLQRAAEAALGQALGQTLGRAGEVEAVVASACGDRLLDACEARALAAAIPGTLVCAVQGATGDCRGAGGALAAAVAVRALAQGVLPATAGYRTADPELPPLAVTREETRCRPRRVLLSALDPDGAAAALVLARAGEGAL